MAQFYYNSHSNESIESQWRQHLQRQSYIDSTTNTISQQIGSVSDIISLQTREMNDTIQKASEEQALAIQQSTSIVCGTLESGLNLLSENLNELSFSVEGLRSEVNNIAALLDWNFSLIIEQQRISSLLLGNIAVLLRIPDIQKERQYHIEKGIKFLKNAFFDSDFYEDALKNLLKAENIEPADFYTLHRIGLIYLYSPVHLDFKKAEEHFKKAAKYAAAESNAGAAVTINYLSGDLSQNLLEQNTTSDTIKLQAAESYMFAGRCCYIQGKFIEAAEYAGKGFDLVPQLVEAGFMQAKALAAGNRSPQSALVLEKVINADRYFSIKTLFDIDLCSNQNIQQLLLRLKNETTDKAKSLFEHSKSKIIPNSPASDLLNEIEQLISMNTYLASLKALDLFEKITEWKFCEPFTNPIQSNQLRQIIAAINSLLKLQYYKDENNRPAKITPTFLDAFIDQISQKSQWIFPMYSRIEEGFVWRNKIESKKVSCNITQFIEFEKKYHDNLPTIISILQGQMQQYKKYNVEAIKDKENENRINTINFKKREQAEAVKGILLSIIVIIGLILVGAVGGAIGALVGYVIGIILQTIVAFYCFLTSGDYTAADLVLRYSTIIGGIIGFIVAAVWAYLRLDQ